LTDGTFRPFPQLVLLTSNFVAENVPYPSMPTGER
jgi:hypothetical protein